MPTPFCVAPSAIPSPSRGSSRGDSVPVAWNAPSGFCPFGRLGKEAGYDGIEIMGSEGYLINQFLASKPTSAKTNGVGSSSGGVASQRKF